MKKNKLLIMIFSFVLTATIFTAVLFMKAPAVPAEAYRIDGIDYSRIIGSNTYTEIPVRLNFDGIVFKGIISRSLRIGDEALEDAINAFMSENRVAGSTLHRAEDRIKNDTELREKFLKSSAEEVSDMAASLTGVDNEVSGIKDIYSTAQHNFSVKSAKHGEDVSFLSDLAATLKNWWGNGSLPKQYKDVNFYVANGFEAAAEFSPSNAGTFNMGKKVHGFFSKLTSFCDFADRLKKLDRKVLAFNEDLRWALDFLRDFYRRLNLYIDKDFTADYRITVNGENTRNFRFMDTDNNVQYWKVAINMQRKERTGGDRYSPAGTYEGDAVISLMHGMYGFTGQIWNKEMGIMRKNWLAELFATGMYDISLGGRLDIVRTFSKKNAKLEIKLADDIGYGKHRPVHYISSKLYYGDYEDEEKISSSLYVSAGTLMVGAENKGYGMGEIEAHIEDGGKDCLKMICDKASAEIVAAFTTSYDLKDVLVKEFWDDNIWLHVNSRVASLSFNYVDELEDIFDNVAADTPATPGTTKNTGKSPVKEIFGEAAPELPKLPERSGTGYTKADYSFAYDPSRYDNGPVDEEIVKAGEALAMLGLVNSDENATYEPEYDSYTSVPEYENIDVSDIDKYFAFFKENDSNYYVGTGAVDTAIGTGCLYGDESNSGGVSSGGTFNGNYADIYKQSIDLTDKFYMIYSTEKDSHNEAIEKKADEEDRFFWNDPEYISFINVPFNIWDSMYFAQFNDKTDLSVIKSGLEFVAEINGDENLVLNRSDDGEYTLTFDGTYYDDDYNEHPSKVTITADVDAASGGICVHEIEYVETLGESFFDMYEFMPLGDGKYALQSGTERLLLETDSSGSISDFAYSVIKEGNAGYSVEDSMFGENTVPDKEWVMEKSSSCVLTAVRTGDKTEFGKPAKK